MSTERHVIIIGAGIGGMATGIALQRLGWRVSVYERASTLEAVGAGLSLWANAVYALDRLGLAAKVRPLLAPSPTGGVYSADGAALVVTNMAELTRQVGEVSGVIHRAELQTILATALGAGVVHLGRACSRIAQHADGVTAYFADGTEAHGDLLIGADGLNSVVRAQIVGDGPPTYAGYTAYRGVTSFELGDIPAGEYWGRGARFGIAPMSAGRVYWFATRSTPPGERLDAETRQAQLLQAFAGWGVPAEAIIRATPAAAILHNDIFFRRPLARWGDGRVTLLGDAAHPMTPDMGQGACQALEDAVALGDALTTYTDVRAALVAYERSRIPRSSSIVLQSRRLGAMGQWQHPLACWLRDTLLRTLVAPIQQRLLAETIGYRVGGRQDAYAAPVS